VYSIDEMKYIAAEVCSKYETLCFDEKDPDELVLFSFTWIENFYYVDPVDCARDLDCIETIFNMHSIVTRLVLENKYSVNIDKDLIEYAVKSLLALGELTRSEYQFRDCVVKNIQELTI